MAAVRSGDARGPCRPSHHQPHPVRLAVSQKGRSAPLGRTRDVSLQGMFIETREPFDVGAVLPLSVKLDARRPLSVRAEVVRKTHDGMGLRFRDLDKETNKRLRRWVVDHTSVAGSRRQIEQLIEESARMCVGKAKVVWLARTGADGRPRTARCGFRAVQRVARATVRGLRVRKTARG